MRNSPRAMGVRPVVSLVAATVLALTLGACWGAGQAPSKVNRAISGELRPAESSGERVVDLDSLIEGNWTRLVVVCKGATSSDVDAALGFAWADSEEIGKSLILGVMIFAGAREVEAVYSVGQDELYEDHWYFAPCGTPEDGRSDERPAAVVISRDEAQLPFRFSTTLGYWYVDQDDLVALGREVGS